MKSDTKCKHYDFELAQAAGIPVDRFPETTEEAQAATDLLVQSLQRLSIEEHQAVVLDIHGFDEKINEKETAPYVNEKLAELQQHLDRITQKEAYNLALQLNSNYVCSRSFRLMFLRCERFNVQAAAEMMVLHFEEKLQLFGNGDILAREILQSDLSPNERAVLDTGLLQLMKQRDAAGRTVLLVVTSRVIEILHNDYATNNVLYRVLWYILMASARDEESQKKGYIWLMMNLCNFKLPLELYRSGGIVHSALPHRQAASHFCYDDPTLHPYVAGFQLFAGEGLRFRMRCHFGTRDEIDRALQAFGLPTDTIPLDGNGTCNLTDHLDWLEATRKQEMNIKTTTLGHVIKESDSETLPYRFDVLFGKSSTAKDHPGTLRAMHLVQMNFATYEKVGKYQKTDLADTIISIIHESGGRFLKQNEKGNWMEASDVEARRKVAHWFRQLRGKTSPSHHPKSVERNSKGTPESVSLKNDPERRQNVGRPNETVN